MPAHRRLRFENDRGSEQRRKQPVEPDEDQPIRSAQPEPRWCRTASGREAGSRATGDLNSPTSQPPSRFKRSIIPVRGYPIYAFAPGRMRFSVGTVCTGTLVLGVPNHPLYGTRSSLQAIFFRKSGGTPWVKLYEWGYPSLSPVTQVGKMVT
jgi:hypothetical protein